MDGLLSRILNLGTRAKLLLVSGFVLLCAGLIASVFLELMYEVPEKVVLATVAAFSAAIPVAFILVLSFFREKREDLAMVSSVVDTLLAETVPTLIRARFFGEPFDPALHAAGHRLGCTVFHRQGEPHVGYRVSFQEINFEFTIILTVYRISLFIWVPFEAASLKRSSLDEACENLVRAGFRMFPEEVPPQDEASSPFTVMMLHRELIDRFANVMFSSHEQFMLAREIAEWARSILRKLAYDRANFCLLPVQFDCITARWGEDPTKPDMRSVGFSTCIPT